MVDAFLELEPYASDPTLLKIQEMLETRASAASVSNPPPAPKPISKPAAPIISSRDRLDVETMVAAAENMAQQNDASQRRELAIRALEHNIPGAAANGGAPWIPYWAARAVLALEVSDFEAGWEAGQNLLQAGALDSQNPTARRVMASLNLKGWLVNDLNQIPEAAEYARWKPFLGTWRSSGKHRFSDVRSSSGDKYNGKQSYEQVVTIDWNHGRPTISISGWNRMYWDSYKPNGIGPFDSSRSYETQIPGESEDSYSDLEHLRTGRRHQARVKEITRIDSLVLDSRNHLRLDYKTQNSSSLGPNFNTDETVYFSVSSDGKHLLRSLNDKTDFAAAIAQLPKLFRISTSATIPSIGITAFKKEELTGR